MYASPLSWSNRRNLLWVAVFVPLLPGCGTGESGSIDGQGFVDEKGRTIFSYAHPIFWAPFSLVGDGGGGTIGT